MNTSSAFTSISNNSNTGAVLSEHLVRLTSIFSDVHKRADRLRSLSAEMVAGQK